MWILCNKEEDPHYIKSEDLGVRENGKLVTKIMFYH